MRWLLERWGRVRLSFRLRDADSGLAEEIQFHLDQQTEKNRQAGMPADEARRRALLQFGGIEGVKERTRDQFRLRGAEDVIRDLRHGARTLLRAPGFTTVAVVTLALGIGATTAMFTVVNGVLLRPLPYPDQHRLVELVHEAPGVGIDRLGASPAIYFAYRDHGRTFESVGLWDWDSSPVTVRGPGEPESLESVEVTHEVLGLLGARAIRGRLFVQADDLPGSAPTVVISYAYWMRRFGGDDPVGTILVVDGVPRHVIGVLPESFVFFEYPAHVFYPLQPNRAAARFPSFDGSGIARLKPGVTIAEAGADVSRMVPILVQEYGEPGAWVQARFGPKLRPLHERVIGGLRDTLWVLMGTMGLLLLIACANVANLIMVRLQTRRPELAVRTALGASRGAIVRVVLAETALLGLAGGTAGVAIASASLPLIASLGAADLPHVATLTLDPAVLLVALGASMLATVISGVIPLVHFASALRVSDDLRAGARTLTNGLEGSRLRQGLMVVQVALALVLLVGCGLMIRTFVTMQQVDPGFRDPADVLTFQLTLPAAEPPDAGPAGVSTPAQAVRMQHAIVERLAALPGIDSVGFAAFDDGLPLDGDGRSRAIFVEGKAPPAGVAPTREVQFVSPGFVETLRTPLVAGRSFDWNDVYQERRVALVSLNLARAEWGSAAAAPGKRIGTGPDGPWLEVVGVVHDVHHYGLTQPAPPTVVFPLVAGESPLSATGAWRTASFVVRSGRVGTTSVMDEIRHAVWAVHTGLSLAKVQTLADLHRRSMARTSMALQLLAITGALALVLGLIGIYGIVGYAISQRHREIGIRLALGAGRGQVRRMFVRQALILVGIGVAIGLGAAAGLTQLMTSQLFGVSPLDPATHASVVLLLAATGGLASYLSAHRASALNPVEVLKGD